MTIAVYLTIIDSYVIPAKAGIQPHIFETIMFRLNLSKLDNQKQLWFPDKAKSQDIESPKRMIAATIA